MFSVLLCPRSSSTKSGSARDASVGVKRKNLIHHRGIIWKNIIFQCIQRAFGFTDIQIKRKAADQGTAGGVGSVQWLSALLHQEWAGLHSSNSPQNSHQTSALAWTWNHMAHLSIYKNCNLCHSKYCMTWCMSSCPCTSVSAEQVAAWGPYTACLLGVCWAGSLVSHVYHSNDISSSLYKTKPKVNTHWQSLNVRCTEKFTWTEEYNWWGF